jgi:hypothetical protein
MLEIHKNSFPFPADPKLSEKAIYFDLNLPRLMDLHQKTMQLSIHANEMGKYYLIWSRMNSGHIDKWK